MNRLLIPVNLVNFRLKEIYFHLSPPQRLLGGGEVDRGKRRCAWDDGKFYPLPRLQIAYTAKEHAREGHQGSAK